MRYNIKTNSVIIEITPVPKPRQTRSDKWQSRPCVLRYRAFADELRLKFGSNRLGCEVDIEFYLPMPASWSNRKKDMMNGLIHQSKPDIDNLVKAVLDSLCEDDSYIWSIKATKRWAKKGKIVFNFPIYKKSI